MTCPGECKVTQLAFVKFFSIVRLSCQIVCLGGCVCVFKCLLRWHVREDAKSHKLHLFHFSPLCVFKCLLKLPAWENAYSHWMNLFGFPPLCFQMSGQIACLCGCKITLVAFVWLFSSALQCVSKMYPQMACPGGCKDVKSHKLHLFDFSPLCVFKCLLKLPAQEDVQLHW